MASFAQWTQPKYAIFAILSRPLGTRLLTFQIILQVKHDCGLSFNSLLMAKKIHEKFVISFPNFVFCADLIFQWIFTQVCFRQCVADVRVCMNDIEASHF